MPLVADRGFVTSVHSNYISLLGSMTQTDRHSFAIWPVLCDQRTANIGILPVGADGGGVPVL